ncbi:MAG: SPFH domain-containing protein [Planctomycetota bacterium]
MVTATVIIAAVIVLFVFLVILFSRYQKVGPNEVLIVSGRRTQDRGFRIVKGGGTFVIPVIEKAERMSLEVMTLDVQTPEVYTEKGVPVRVDGVAQIKIRGDLESITTAAEQFLSKSQEEIMRVALQTVEGHLRAILGAMNIEDIYKNRDAFAGRVQEVAATDLANMGLQIVSFTLRDIKDSQGYLDALGKPRTAQVKKDAIVGQAEADREATIRSAQAQQAAQEAKYAADTKIAESQRDYEMRRAEYQASVNTKKAEADLAYDVQKYKTSQAVKSEEIQVQVVERERLIEVQEKEISRREKELMATVQKPAEAERQKIQALADAELYKIRALADAERYKIEAEGAGHAAATKAVGFGEAEATKAKGFAQAEVIKAQGFAEAEAMEKKAQSWRAYNEAAITQMFIDKMPELARAIAEPLSKTEKIVIVNTGGGDGGAGASRITKDVTEIIAQLPVVIESLTGISLKDLVSRIPHIKRIEKDKEAGEPRH